MGRGDPVDPWVLVGPRESCVVFRRPVYELAQASPVRPRNGDQKHSFRRGQRAALISPPGSSHSVVLPLKVYGRARGTAISIGPKVPVVGPAGRARPRNGIDRSLRRWRRLWGASPTLASAPAAWRPFAIRSAAPWSARGRAACKLPVLRSCNVVAGLI
jgi:hypothetical protein